MQEQELHKEAKTKKCSECMNWLWAKVKIPEVYRCCKRFKLCDGKHTKKTLAAPEVVIPYGCIVLLSSCVQNVDLHLLPIQDNFLPVAVGFGGLVVFNKLLWKKNM